MDRERLRQFLEAEIGKERQKIAQLGKRKSEGDSARASWSAHDMLDIETEMVNRELYVVRCLTALEAVKANPSLDAVAVGSFVTISVEGEEMSYLMVSERGGPIGDYWTLSQKSPIGKAIWGKEQGEAVVATTPDGAVAVEVLKVE